MTTKQKMTFDNPNQFPPSNPPLLIKESYPPLRVSGPSCALSWVHRRSTAHSTVPGLWPGVGFGTTPGEVGTLHTEPRSRWHRSHTHTGIYSWAWSSAHCGRSHHHAHSLFPPYLERNDSQSHTAFLETCRTKYKLLTPVCVHVLAFMIWMVAICDTCR